MRTLLNIVWLLTGGIWLALGYFLAGILACLAIVTLPAGVASFRLARYALWPFGKTVVDRHDAGVGSAVVNVIWLVLAGWWLALGHILSAVAQAVTIVGLPLAVANLKLIPISLAPFGKRIVDSNSLAAWDHPVHSMRS
ncbi:YccF domain-containing protein [Nigerium massiliense]|uniref:YccF domain-containing protein n=1 Tax=Nigerium massiliense TaxID=1522317 RepID=UPI00058ED551|nr:YccF domain-containing protein [Nigerium massiliense]